MRPIVLFVDDEQDILEGIKRALRGALFEVVTATSASRAMQVFATTAVDVVVCDERMPGVSGTEFLHQVRRSHPDVVRIALTGESDLDRMTRLIRDGELYRFLSKPLDRSELLRTLDGAIGVRLRAQESARLRQDPRHRQS
jgi:two-component system probable response regulator PhcQ